MKQTSERERYTFRPSMFFEGQYQVVDAKGTPIGSARDLSDAETITRYLNKAGREEVEPLEAEVAKLRALVQELVNAVKMESDFGNALLNKKNVHGAKAELHTRKALSTAKEQGFVPTNTQDK